MTSEELATRKLDTLMLGAFTSGLEQGFTVGKGRPPRPEDWVTLNKIAELVMSEAAAQIEAL